MFAVKIRFPNPWLVATAAGLLGGLTGISTAVIMAASTPLRTAATAAAGLAAEGPQPQLETDATVHEFGRVAVGGSGSHEFTIRNTGDAPLVLTKGATSCTCTVSDFSGPGSGDGSSRTVPPGSSTTVRIEWKGKGGGGPFRQRATILTNDPKRPEVAFSIEGQVVPLWRAEPSVIALTGLSASSPTETTAALFTFGARAAELIDCRVVADKLTDLVTVSAEPLPPDTVERETGATGGFGLTLQFATGLPLGKLRGDVETIIRLDGEELTITIPLEGTVTGDFTVVGQAWDKRAKAVRLGTVSRREGLVTKLFVMAKGPGREQVRPAVKEVIPAGLEVEVAPPQPIGDGGLIRIGLTLSISSGSATANNLCTEAATAGKIVLETGHPDTPELTIPVCVAIAE
ncbi:MAG: DUF1573 domain-containing protein [Planctomycetia bacterium]|nr:DUF1573 domain-containing protein [Planctomycetia bacterium]